MNNSQRSIWDASNGTTKCQGLDVDLFVSHINKIVEDWPDPLKDAVRYCTRGGKKYRFKIPYAVGMSIYKGAPNEVLEEWLITVGSAIEMIHCASLIIDDLPSMDNANKRRNKWCVHKPEAWSPDTNMTDRDTMAISQLTATALYAEALNQLMGFEYPIEMGNGLALVHRFTGARSGLVAGQLYDIFLKKTPPKDWDEYYRMIDGKTGALFSMCFVLGWILGNGNAEQQFLETFINETKWYGRYFQILDDISDSDDETTYNNCVRAFGRDKSISALSVCKQKYIEFLERYSLKNKFLRTICNKSIQ